MFNDILSESTSRLTEVRDMLNFIKLNTPNPPQSPKPIIIALRGMFFVQLYGSYEYTIRSTIIRTIEEINQFNPKLFDCKRILTCLILNDGLNALAAVGEKKKWEKRWNLAKISNINNNITINPDLMPTDGKNFRYKQLNSIWTSFGVSDPILPRNEIGGRIDEIVELRNAIAHGNQSPLEIGKRFTNTDLNQRFDDINEYCTYVISTFENYISNKLYLNVT